MGDEGSSSRFRQQEEMASVSSWQSLLRLHHLVEHQGGWPNLVAVVQVKTVGAVVVDYCNLLYAWLTRDELDDL